MAETSGVEAPVKAPAAADSFAEHKRIRGGEKVAAAITPPKEADTSAASKNKPAAPAKGDTSEPDKGESAEASGTSNKESQEIKDKSAKGRINEAEEREAKARQKSADVRAALARAKAAEEEADRLEQELATKRKPASEPAKADPKPAAAAADDPKPKLSEFTAKAETYEEALEKWEEASSDWRDRQRKKQSAETEQQASRAKTREALQRRTVEARTKYEDFDTVTAGDMKTGSGLILTPPMQQYVIESDNGLDVAYYLGKNRDEYDRIFVLTPARQIAELGKIEDKVSGATKSNASPDNKQPTPVSKVTPPPRIVSGSEPATSKSLSDASSMDEHRRLRKSKQA